MKQRTCKICKQKFTPDTNMFLPPTCSSYECRTEYAMKHLSKSAIDKKKQANKLKKEFNENDRKYLIEIAQKTCNTYIRMRDKDEPCISCQKIIGDNEISHASHFRPATNSRLRFDERNVHKSCVKCNVFLSSNAIEYKKALVIKLGADVVEELECTNEPYRYSIEELKDIIKSYKQKIKDLNVSKN